MLSISKLSRGADATEQSTAGALAGMQREIPFAQGFTGD